VEQREALYQQIVASVVAGDTQTARQLAQAVVEAGIPPREAIVHGYTRAIQIVGDRYDRRECFVPEVLVAAEAMRAGVQELKGYLEDGDEVSKGTVVIASIEGDLHDIGKNIVALMLEMQGYRVHDLGRDVPVDRVIDEAQAQQADVIAVSALMTTSMKNMARLIERLVERGCREQFTVAIGGAAVNQAYCERIGADLFAHNAVEAVRRLERLLKVD
jgi:corrinoid protein of di/trimethylamine methyltransferase